MKVNGQHNLQIWLDEGEEFTAQIVTGDRKRRKVDVKVRVITCSDASFEPIKHPGWFGRCTVRGFYYKQDGELAALQKSGDMNMDQLPLDIRSQVVSFFWTLVPRTVVVAALGTPLRPTIR